MSFKLSQEDKINLGLGVGGFVILLLIRNTAQMNAMEAPQYLATIGGLFGLARWWASNKSNALKNLKSIFKILLFDTDINKYSLIPLGVPLVYSVLQATLLGSTLGFILDWVHNVMHKNAYLPQEMFLYSALSSIVLLLVIRMILESIYKGK